MAQEKAKVATIQKVERTIAKKDDRHEELYLMNDYNTFIQEISPSCLAISVLGQLMLVTQERDISLESAPPKDGFKLIKYPHSLRASLVQVANDGYRAFQAAHINMDKINQFLTGVPDLINEVIKATATGTPDDVAFMTELALESLKERADKCVTLAHDTESKFGHVMDELMELQEASASQKGVEDKKLEEALLKQQILKNRQANQQKEMEELEEAKKKNRKLLEEATSQFTEALDSMPTAGDMFLAKLGETLIDTIAVPSKVFGTAIEVEGETAGGMNMQHIAPDDVVQSEDNMRAAVMNGVIETIVGRFDDEEDTLKVDITPEECLQWQEQMKMLKKRVKSDKESKAILDKAVTLCGPLYKLLQSRSFRGDQKKIQDLKGNFDKLFAKSHAKYAKIQKEMGGNPTASRNPADAKYKKGAAVPKKGIVETMTENAHLKVTMASERLKEKERQNEAAEKAAREGLKELHSTMEELAQVDLTKSDIESVQRVLQKGFSALSEVREIWYRLALFFSRIARLVEEHHDQVQFFDKATCKMLKSRTDFCQRFMYKCALNATQSAVQVKSLAELYTKVSDKYFLPPLNILPRLTMPNAGDNVNRLAWELKEQCESSSKGIQDMLDEEGKKYKKRLQQRIEKLEEAKESLPPLPPAKQAEIQQSVCAGLGNEEITADDINVDDY